jgi:5'(3')-deoxyribonucleotidase
MKLTESTFLLYAMKNYDNPQCTDMSEFEEDMKRFQYLRKLFSRYRQDNDLKERLILNHLIVIYNVFGVDATNMLFLKLHEYHSYLKPFVEYLNYMPQVLQYDENIINKDSIIGDIFIEEKLKEI